MQPRPKAASVTPAHNRELAPDRLDGLANVSAIRPQLSFVSHTSPLAAPKILPRRSQVFSEFEPPPAPVFRSSRRSQPYPSSCENELFTEASTPLGATSPLPMFSPLQGARQSHTRSSPQNASQQHVEFRQRKLAEQLFEQVCSFCISFSVILSNCQSFELQSNFLPLLIRKYSPSTIKRYCVSF